MTTPQDKLSQTQDKLLDKKKVAELVEEFENSVAAYVARIQAGWSPKDQKSEAMRLKKDEWRRRLIEIYQSTSSVSNAGSDIPTRGDPGMVAATVELPEPDRYMDARGYTCTKEWIYSDESSSDYRLVYNEPLYEAETVRRLLAEETNKGAT